MTGTVGLGVVVDIGVATPPYEQIRTQVAALVHSGALADGDRLPTVRALAADLGVAAGTVARAYTELEVDGLVQGRGRLGTVVTSTQGDPALARLQVTAHRLVDAARTDGLDDDAVRTAVETALLGRPPS
ncbi:GntR family transcriptional regulator [Modestobacter sp. I12A-02628]|uniref:GntR family transcriptional regulator n=1 Tax=Goekera deserti TaxID=2497753 RepID=A0A7K3WH98_9ACTN|nr:GntR family transcriptional regulator [Goekera deserti]MPQ97305.1 GntR family transcriptional regulator [Goekera deserti]NDI50184.1 GntR family transcriptional regulator [Goekera deserti]NEL55752.1 GntR family transcriptional regulator [Goekera deserti]